MFKNIEDRLIFGDGLKAQSDANDFLKLVERYGHHYHKDEPTGRDGMCLLCQSFTKLENMQGDVSHAMVEKNRDYAIDSMPF